MTVLVVRSQWAVYPASEWPQGNLLLICHCCTSMIKGFMRDAGTLHHGAEGAVMHAQQGGHAVILQPLAIVHHQHLHRSVLVDIRRCSGRYGERKNVTGAHAGTMN